MNLICAITVIVNMGGIGWATKTDAEGRLVAKSNTHYVVNFSAEAKAKGWLGDYSKRFVKKENCVVLKK